MDVDLHDPRDDPEPDGWADFTAREGLAAVWSYAALRGASRPSRAPVLLAVFREGGAVRGAVAAVHLGVRASTSDRPPLPRREPLLLDVRLPGEGDEVSWHFDAKVPEEARPGLLRDFERAVRRRLGLGLVGALYRHVTPGRLGEVDRRGAHVRPSVGTARMRLDWPSADGWLASLRRGRRQDLRRRARLLDADPGLRLVLGRGRTDLAAADLARLAAGQQRRLQPRFDRRAPLPEQYFAALLDRDDVSFLTYTEPDGRLLAFSTMTHQPGRLNLGLWAGVPVEEGGRGSLYYDHYLRAVRHAFATGAREMSAGRGRLDVKTDLGFAEVPMRLVVVPRWALG